MISKVQLFLKTSFILPQYPIHMKRDKFNIWFREHMIARAIEMISFYQCKLLNVLFCFCCIFHTLFGVPQKLSLIIVSSAFVCLVVGW